jgi:hypothetical protein
VLKPELEGLVSFLPWFTDRYLPHCVDRVIVLETDVIMRGDIQELWDTRMGERVLAAPRWCTEPVEHFFYSRFWAEPALSGGLVPPSEARGSSASEPHAAGVRRGRCACCCVRPVTVSMPL